MSDEHSHAGDPGAAADDPRLLWLALSDFVLDHTRRRAVAEATGLSFARTRALRRLARRAMSMREFADALDVDPPNASAIAADLESLGLAQRRPHPTDGRVKLVEATPAGRAVALKADAILAEPPPGLAAMNAEDRAALAALIEQARCS